jgi:hypothetical protein
MGDGIYNPLQLPFRTASVSKDLKAGTGMFLNTANLFAGEDNKLRTGLMVSENSAAEKAKAIVKLLPHKNCGKCGFENCGKFALALISIEASPFGCRQDSSTGYAICKILGIAVSEAKPSLAGRHLRPGHGHGHSGHHGEVHSRPGQHGHHKGEI